MNVKKAYVKPAIEHICEGLPAYTRAYSNTCPFLSGSSGRRFFEAQQQEKEEVRSNGMRKKTGCSGSADRPH